jgi:hypothetical protein
MESKEYFDSADTSQDQNTFSKCTQPPVNWCDQSARHLTAIFAPALYSDAKRRHFGVTQYLFLFKQLAED